MAQIGAQMAQLEAQMAQNLPLGIACSGSILGCQTDVAQSTGFRERFKEVIMS